MEKVDWDKLIANLQKQGKLSTSAVIKAFKSVPRTKFLPLNMQKYSNSDTPLQIGFAQTVSAPHIVAIMDEALELKIGNKVLEVGAGSGWQAATLAEIVAPKDAPRSEWGHIYAVEIVSALADSARKNVLVSGFSDRISIVVGDGIKGYAEKAPFDRILVTAAAPEIPPVLIDQLKVGGILLMPVGSPFLFQKLLKVTKQVDSKLEEKNLGKVSFAPLTSQKEHKN